MNKKKKIILILLLVLVGSLCINVVTAKIHTTKEIKFKDSMEYPVNKYVGKGEYASVYYNSKYSTIGSYRENFFAISILNIHDLDAGGNYKIIKAKVKFTQNVNGRTKTTTKTYKPNKDGYIEKNNPKGLKPYSTIITYKDVKFTQNTVKPSNTGTTSTKSVFIAPYSGKKYHYNKNCRGLSNANSIKSVSLSTAKNQGYTLCGWED